LELKLLRKQTNLCGFARNFETQLEDEKLEKILADYRVLRSGDDAAPVIVCDRIDAEGFG
jgi:hypothetical protein